MQIIIDADACPDVGKIVSLAKIYHVPVLVVFDNTHLITSDYATLVTCDKGYQSVDMYIVNNIKDNDIVITGDYGIANIALLKTNYVVHPSGYLYSNSSIDEVMFKRYINNKARKMGKHIKGPRKRTNRDSVKFLNLVEDILKKCYNG